MWKVSIIVTCYCHQEYISQTIDSIFSQTYNNWEILIGDDSPNNLSRDIIQEKIKKHWSKVKAWHHFPSKHIVWNTNFLLSQVDPNSEFIAFLEWDDLWTPSYLQEKIDIFNQYPDVWLVYNELSIINSKNEIIEKNRIKPRTRKRFKNETDTIWNLLLHDLVCFSYSTLMSRAFPWMKINDRWNKELLWSESDFRLQISRKHNLYGIEDALTLYRKHWNNTSSNLDFTIGHYYYLISNYFTAWIINKQDFDKLTILVNLMRMYSSAQQLKIKESFMYLRECIKISFIETTILWGKSFYYRLLRPSVLKFHFS